MIPSNSLMQLYHSGPDVFRSVRIARRELRNSPRGAAVLAVIQTNAFRMIMLAKVLGY